MLNAQGQFRRVLGPLSLTLLGIGGIVGTGISVVTGIAAAKHAGPALVISFAISGFVALLTALCYAELASAITNSGSAYSYARLTMGKFVGWIVGWFLILEYLIGLAAVAVGWSAYFRTFMHSAANVRLELAVTSAPFERVDGATVLSGAFANVPAAALILLLAIPVYLGIRQSSVINAIVTTAKIGVLLLVLALCSGAMSAANWQPFVPENQGVYGEFGWSGVLRASALVFFAYIGFDTVTTLSQESRRPERDVPIGVVASLLVSIVIYIIGALVITGVVPYHELNVADPLSVLVSHTPTAPAWLGVLVSAGSVVGLTSVVFVTLVGQARILYALANDGFLPPAFAYVHRSHGTPHVATLAGGIFAALIAALFPLDILGELVSMGTLLAFALVCASVIILRRTRPDLPRRFKVPLYPWVPGLGLLFCVGLMFALPLNTWVRLLVWLLIGLAIYAFVGRTIRHAPPALDAREEPSSGAVDHG